MTDVKDFGAAGDGVTKDTAAIQRAIDAGGMVFFPPGIYLTGTLYLKSDGGLCIDAGAVLKASPDQEDYNADDFCPQNRFSTAERASGAHLIAAVGEENITICGAGRIDGSRPSFYGEAADQADTQEHLEKFSLENMNWRPGQMIFFCECRNVSVRDVQLYHAPYWTLFFHGCSDVQARGLRIFNDQRTVNGDGIDIDCCRRVTVSDCIIDTGDDCITLRGNEDPLEHKQNCEHVTVANCVLHTNCNCIRVGVGRGRIRGAVFSNIICHRSRTGVALTSNYTTDPLGGAEISDISFENMLLECRRPFFITSFVRGSRQEPAAREIRNISFRHIRGTFQRSLCVCGSGGKGIRNLSFEDMELTCTGCDCRRESDFSSSFCEWYDVQPDAVFFVSHADGVRLERVRVLREQGEEIPQKYGLAVFNSLNVTAGNCDLGEEICQDAR